MTFDIEQVTVREPPPPRFEYAEANSLGRVNELAAQGWRLAAFTMSNNGVKVYVLEREKTDGR